MRNLPTRLPLSNRALASFQGPPLRGCRAEYCLGIGQKGLDRAYFGDLSDGARRVLFVLKKASLWDLVEVYLHREGAHAALAFEWAYTEGIASELKPSFDRPMSDLVEALFRRPGTPAYMNAARADQPRLRNSSGERHV